MVMGCKVSSPPVRLRDAVELNDNTVYLAASDGYVVVYLYSADANDIISIYTDTDATPSDRRALDQVGSANGSAGCSCPVKKGLYWKATNDSSSVAAKVFWNPQR
jgi:hypothetical protein